MQVVKTLGVLVCLFGAYLMYDGNILGENTAGLDTVIGIIGIGIIRSSINSRSLEEERHLEGD